MRPDPIFWGMDRSLPVPAPLSADPAPEIAALAERWKRANGPVIALLNRLGGSIESQLSGVVFVSLPRRIAKSGERERFSCKSSETVSRETPRRLANSVCESASVGRTSSR